MASYMSSEAIITLGGAAVEWYRMDDGNSHLFCFVEDWGYCYHANFMCSGSYRLYNAHQREILGNCTFKTLAGLKRKLRRMGFDA